MNKIFLWIVLAVIILGLLLILLNTRMGQSGDAPAACRCLKLSIAAA